MSAGSRRSAARDGGSETPPAIIAVLHLITTMDVGGAELSLLRLVSRMDRRRFRSTLVSIAGPGTLLDEVRRAGVEAHALSRTPSLGVSSLRRLAALIRTQRPAILQTWLYHADLLGLLVGKALRVPAIAWNVRCAELDRTDHPRSLFWIVAALARLSALPDVVVANSVTGRGVHEALGYRARRWQVIPNGFDTERFAPSEHGRLATRQRLGLAGDELAVGLVARYHPMKDHATFLAACERVAAAVPRVRFVLAGRQVDAGNAQLRALIARHGLAKHTHLLGEEPDAALLYQGLDLLVSSSYSEAFPNVIGEAMATGVPVVATDAGDSAHILAQAGWVVPRRDPEALGAAIVRALALTPQERSRLGLRGRDRVVAEFSLERAVASYEALYERLARDDRRAL